MRERDYDYDYYYYYYYYYYYDYYDYYLFIDACAAGGLPQVCAAGGFASAQKMWKTAFWRRTVHNRGGLSATAEDCPQPRG